VKPIAPLAAACLLAVAGCSATMSKDECKTVDWRTIGYEDGVAGRSGEQIGLHRKACAEYGVTPDLNAYRAGRAEGLREFCHPHNGYRAGVTGAAYYDGCPAELAPAFEESYEYGRQLYIRERRVDDADAQIADDRRRIAHLEDSVARNAFDAIADDATPEQRVDGVLDAKQAAERISRLKAEISRLEKDRAQYLAELDAYRSTHPPR
jgi:ribosome modulation factor